MTGSNISIKGNKNSIQGAITNTTLTCEGDEFTFFCFGTKDSTLNLTGGKNELKVSSLTSLKLKVESLERSMCEIEGYADIEYRGDVYFKLIRDNQDPVCFNSTKTAKDGTYKKITTLLDQK